MATHKWSKEICAWAEGKSIQYNSRGMWEDFDSTYDPNWKSEKVEWRIKPAEPEREYPVTHLDGLLISEKLDEFSHRNTSSSQDYMALANWILSESCDKGEIVTRAEFDRAVGDRQKRDMAVAEAVADYAYREGAQCLGAKQLDAIIDNVK